MHWLAIVFLVLKALDDTYINMKIVKEHRYNSLLAYLIGSFVNIFAWCYVLSYVFCGLQ